MNDSQKARDDLDDPATLAHIARLSFSSLNEKKHIFETLARFDSEQSELLDVISSLENGREVVAPFTSVAFIEGRITNCDELLVKLSSNEEQLYVERTRDQTCEMLKKRQSFAKEKLLRAEQELRASDIEHRETMKVLSEKFESLNGEFGEKIEKEEPESRVIEGPNRRKTLLTPRDGEIVDVLEIDETSTKEGDEEREDEVMQMRNEKEIERDRKEREIAKAELESWMLKIEEMERLEEDAGGGGGGGEEEAVTMEEGDSTKVASNSRNSHSDTSTRIQIRDGMDSGMLVIERGFEKDGEKRDTGAQSGDGENREKPMSKFKMRQLGLL